MSFRSLSLALCALVPFVTSPGQAQEGGRFGVPVRCDPKTGCAVQQFPDMQAGPGTADPFCEGATYDGHDGTDIRIRALPDISNDVPVVAMAAGKVLRLRDGEPDRLAGGPEARASLGGKECGNGLVVDHGGGFEVQYCHLKQGSIGVRPGENVAEGQTLGFVGASGWAQFPHVHVTVRKKGVAIDPATGRTVGAGCSALATERHPLWSPAALGWMAEATRPILDAGLAGAVFDPNRLVEQGTPPPLSATSTAVIGWGWFVNLRGGDRIRIRITDPAGAVFTDTTSDPLPGPKASYSQMAGRKRAPVPGRYRLDVEVLRSGAVVAAETRSLDIAG